MVKEMFILFRACISESYSLSRLSGAFGGRRNKARPGMGAMAVILAIAVVSIYFSVFFYYSMIADVLITVGALGQLISMAALITVAGTLFMGFYKAPGFLYASKDFDMLTALPVRPEAILGSKLMSLYVACLLPTMLLGFPGVIVYGVKAGAGPLFYVVGLVLLLVLAVIPMLIGAAVAFPVAFAGSKSRFSNALILIINIAILITVVVASYVLPSASSEAVEAGVTSLSGFARYYPPLTMYENAAVHGGFGAGSLLTAVTLGVAAAFIYGLSRVHRRINAALGEKYARSNFKMGKVKASGVWSALFKKEVRGYFSSYMCVLNTSVGVLLFAIYVVASSLFGYEAVAEVVGLPGGKELFVAMTALVGGFCMSMCQITASSISLEGKELWILKSLPVSFRDVALAKISLGLAVLGPITAVSVIFFGIANGIGAETFAGMLLFLLAMGVFISVLGLVINLHLPKLEWKNPVQAVKQSASAMLAMLCGVVAMGLLVAGYVVLELSIGAYLLLSAAVLGLLATGLWIYLRLKGQQLFDRL